MFAYTYLHQVKNVFQVLLYRALLPFKISFKEDHSLHLVTHNNVTRVVCTQSDESESVQSLDYLHGP